MTDRRKTRENPEDISGILNMLNPVEKFSLFLRNLYENAGFTQYRMGRFEEYELYHKNRRFLTDERLITFTDIDGRLLALKPDVTLSIAKNAPINTNQGIGKFWYLESVYRPSRENQSFREIRQMGLECVGAVDDDCIARTAELAARSLYAAGRPWVLEIGHMGFVTGLFDACHAPEHLRAQALAYIRDRKFHELKNLNHDNSYNHAGIRQDKNSGADPDVKADAGQDINWDIICKLKTLSGDWDTVITKAEDLIKELPGQTGLIRQSVKELRLLRDRVAEWEIPGESIRLDLSLVNDMDYYNGLVLRGFLEGLPRPVLKGGRYDPLAARFRPGAKAIGFALYLNELERLDTSDLSSGLSGDINNNNILNNASGGMNDKNPDKWLSIALPKGRLGDKVYNLLSKSGYAAEGGIGDTRRLVLENPEAKIKYFLVKPSDVAIYVEHGAADVGIAGLDILEESGADVYELLDTGLGKCRMCVAGRRDFPGTENLSGRTLRVATKFVNIARRYFAGQGREIDIIPLNGSIELAPLLNLSDVIVDIVETGTTLKENNLRVISEFMRISARLIANRASYQFKPEKIDRLTEKFREAAVK